MSLGISDDHARARREPAVLGRLDQPARRGPRGRDRSRRVLRRRLVGADVDGRADDRAAREAAVAAGDRCSTSRSRSRRVPTHWSPGHLLGTAIASALLGESDVAPAIGSGARVAVGLGDVVLDAPGADLFLLPYDGGYVVASSASVTPGAPVLDLSRRVRRRRPPRVVSRCLLTDELLRRTADHVRRRRGRRCGPLVPRHRGRLREGARAVRGEDRVLPGDQAPVRADARDDLVDRGGRLGRRVGRPPRPPPRSTTRSGRFAADVAATVAFDGAVRVAQDCIQVLGGIGFTFEHDAHLYLRRAHLAAGAGRVVGRRCGPARRPCGRRRASSAERRPRRSGRRGPAGHPLARRLRRRGRLPGGPGGDRPADAALAVAVRAWTRTR